MMTSLRHNAAPTPRPMEMSMELGEQSPKNRSATSAALVSLPTITGTPVAFSTSVFSGSSLHPKCTDLRTTPLGSTMPVTAMPMPRVGSGVELMSCLQRSITSLTLQPWSTGSSVRSTILPERSASAPLTSIGFDRSTETIRQKSVSMASTCERLPRFAIVGAEFAQNAIVDHFAGHFAGGEARKSDEFADIGSRHLRCGEKLFECGGDIADSNIGR